MLKVNAQPPFLLSNDLHAQRPNGKPTSHHCDVFFTLRKTDGHGSLSRPWSSRAIAT